MTHSLSKRFLKNIDSVSTDRKMARPFFRNILHVLHTNKIEYVVDAGTLLGAVRNQSEILWDDDYDIYMTKKSIEAFSKVLIKKQQFITDSTTEDMISANTKYHFEFTPVGDPKQKRIRFFTISAIIDDVNDANHDVNDKIPVHIVDVFYEGDNSGWTHPTEEEMFPLQIGKLGDMNVAIPYQSINYLNRVFGKNCMNEYKICNKYLHPEGWLPEKNNEYETINAAQYKILVNEFNDYLEYTSNDASNDAVVDESTNILCPTCGSSVNMVQLQEHVFVKEQHAKEQQAKATHAKEQHATEQHAKEPQAKATHTKGKKQSSNRLAKSDLKSETIAEIENKQPIIENGNSVSLTISES